MTSSEFKSRFKKLSLGDKKTMVRMMEIDSPKNKELSSDELNNILKLIEWCKILIKREEG